MLFFTFPLIWILCLTAAAYIFRKKSLGRKLLASAIVLFVFFSNGYIFSEVFKYWEGKNTALNQVEYEGVILLGGYSGWNTRHVSISFNEGSDRFIKAIELYKKGKVKKIILSGGSGLLLKPEEKESELIIPLLISLGIPDSAILLENESRNTYENAVFTYQLLNEKNLADKRYILVTSAFHMRRAENCFRKTGLNFDTIRVDFRIDDDDYIPATYIVPSAVVLENWQLLIKEWLGFIAYRLKGYF